jgi:hypothetical protein
MVGRFRGSANARIGRFVGRPTAARWAWDADLFAILGYESAAAAASVELFMHHVPDDEHELVRAAFCTAAESQRPFTLSFRLHATDGRLRSVLVAAELTVARPDGSAWNDLLDLTGGSDVSGPWLAGQLIDLTELRLAATREVADEAVAASAQHRAVIEQAKGALMLAYRMDADTAFGWLRRRSQDTNTKLHDVAAELVARLPAGQLDDRRAIHVDLGRMPRGVGGRRSAPTALTASDGS